MYSQNRARTSSFGRFDSRVCAAALKETQRSPRKVPALPRLLELGGRTGRAQKPVSNPARTIQSVCNAAQSPFQTASAILRGGPFPFGALMAEIDTDAWRRSLVRRYASQRGFPSYRRIGLWFWLEVRRSRRKPDEIGM